MYGFRWEYYDNYVGTTISAFNPRLAFAFLPSDNWIIRAMYSEAVRPPSIYEIVGNNFLPGLYGSTGLTFEKLKTIEFSIKYKKAGFEINLNPYYEILKDRISYVPSAIDATALIATNTGELEVLGVEVSSKYSWGSSNYVFLNGSKLDSKDIRLGQRTPYLPDLYVNGGINLAFGKMNYNWTVFYRGDRSLPDELIINRERAGGSQLMNNLAITYNLKQGIEAYVMIENVFDGENYVPLNRDGMYVPLRRRTVNLGFNLKF